MEYYGADHPLPSRSILCRLHVRTGRSYKGEYGMKDDRNELSMLMDSDEQDYVVFMKSLSDN